MTDSTIEQYPVLPLRTEVFLPSSVVAIEVGRPASLRSVDAAERDDDLILLAPQMDPKNDAELCDVGVLAEITQVVRHSKNRYTVLARCIERQVILEMTSESPYLIASVKPLIPTATDRDIELIEEKRAELAKAVMTIVAHGADDDDTAMEDIERIEDMDHLIDLAVSNLDLPRDELLALLKESSTYTRYKLIHPTVEHLNDVLTVKSSIDAEIEGEMSTSEREKVLRQRLKSIREELGEDDSDEVAEFRERLAESKISEEGREAVKKQLNRMDQMPPGSPEYSVARNYVETLMDIPWEVYTEDNLDLQAARAVLDAEHSGLDKIKKRIVEFLAVRKLVPDKKGPIMCLVGPPGVGKTSLARSVANALGREYVRCALGGVRDESEIRGHRRTYVGSIPGRIIASLKKAKTMNPLFVLDEIDKLGSGQRGDPGSALLEVLDPEQNSEFVDHYVEVPVDLSRVIFWATANQLEPIKAALRDRMEVIRLPGYTSNEKLEIAKDHLLPKERSEHGLEPDQLEIPDAILMQLIENYTREAGVRNLQREIASLCRTAAVEIAKGKAKVVFNDEMLYDTLGAEKFSSEAMSREPEAGVATGLAWTPTGGEIQFIEAKLMPGKGRMRLTGQMGDIMQESAQIAMSWVKTNATKIGIEKEKFENYDLHIHVPAGATRKDGPSGGVALAIAMASALSDRKVDNLVAITGELTLRGNILQVGGIKEKLLGAYRAGIKTVLLPERNEKDLIDLPESIREELNIILVGDAFKAISIAVVDPAKDVAAADAPSVTPAAEKPSPHSSDPA